MPCLGRQRLWVTAIASSCLLLAPAAWAVSAPTPAQAAVAFYPVQLPEDRDNDLTQVRMHTKAASGVVVELFGQIVDAQGEPVAGAQVEIWQADAGGHYFNEHHGRDENFQGYGQATTDSNGQYSFVTVRPGAAGTRAPHINIAVSVAGKPRFVTQCYIRGERHNASDPQLNALSNPARREQLIVPFVPVAGAKVEKQVARFDIVLGLNAPPTALAAYRS
ncbi:hypothetical protein AX279_03090 [Pseudomonas sp. J237]|nr:MULTISPECIES: protocatechuate 3,4-dioxygenase [Pseudomonas]OEO27279.1 hypothetical protein AX279_03090 [Pseudomonas sp. J237]